ncbi:MAG: protein kinase [Pirellulaceae bacterium]|nr:protein kinase [Pirellulaceae bacterium]
MDMMLAELERGFRENWSGFRPSAYEPYLQQVDDELRSDLLIRLLCAEIEFSYQPPVVFRNESSVVPMSDDDDQRVRPTLRLFLLRFPELRSRVDGIIQLSVLEYALRIRYDSKPPNISSYLELCESEQDRLGGLLQLTEMRIGDSRELPAANPIPVKSGDSTEPESSTEKPVVLDQLPCNLGCFLLIRQLGKGGMGNVYSAIDLRSTAHVAVKVMRHLDSWSIYRFVEEFSWLSQLNHPHLVKLYDAFSQGDTRYFSMEQVEGLTIRNWFQTLNPDDPSRWNMLRQVLAETASAIRFLHDCDVIHRDVKPSNLMITPGRRAMLLDLGLAMRSGKTTAGLKLVDGSKIVGTIQYLPPEALRGESQTFASDWYSFGVLIFETITNSFPPFAIDPKNNDLALRYQVNEEALREKLKGLPDDLITLCIDLLSVDPRARPLGNEIIQRLGAEDTRALSFAADTICLGRDDVLNEITSCFHEPFPARKLVLLRGESGIGKTTVLRHWTRSQKLKDDSTLLLHFSCHLQDHTPLRALNLLAQQLVTLLPEVPRELWEDLTSSEGAEIVYGFPQMQQLIDVQPRQKDPTVGVQELAARRAAGLHALLYWLRELSRRCSVIIAIDDAQWADADSGRLLSQLFSSSSGFQGLLLVADQGHLVKSPLVESMLNLVGGLENAVIKQLELKPLDKSVCAALLEKWSTAVGLQLQPAIYTDLTRRSAGNPFLLREVLSAYVCHVSQFALDDEAWLKTSRTQGRGGHLRSRFSLLPISMERVLQYLAIADEPLGFHQLHTVSRVLPHELLPLINYLASQGWIRINGASLDSELEIAHDRFRDVVLDSMPEDRRYRRHYRIARTLSSESPPPWSRIAHHYWEAKRFREAAACYMEAARSSARSSANIEALWFLERAFHPNADRSVVEQRNALRLQADCFAASGKATEAIESYRTLATSSEDKAESHLLNCLMGEQWISKGNLSEGLRCLSGALGDLGVTEDLGSSWFSSMRLWMEARQMSTASRRNDRDYEPFSATEQCLNRLGTALAFLDIGLGSNLTMALANASAHRGSDSDRAITMLRWGGLISLGSRRTRSQASKWIRSGRRLAKLSGNANAIALAQVCTFLWLFAHGRFRRAQFHGLKALNFYRAAGLTHQWEYGFIQWMLLTQSWYAGELKSLVDATKELRIQWQHNPDLMWSFWVHTHSAHLADLIADQPDEGRRALSIVAPEIQNQAFQSPKYFLWLSELRQELYEGNTNEALRIKDQGWKLFSESRVSNFTHYMWAANSLRLCCCLESIKVHPEHRELLLKEASTICRQLRGIQEPKFALVAEAQELVVRAAMGKIATRSRWAEVIDQLQQSGMILYSLAAAWHASIHWPNCDFTGDDKSAEQRFREQGSAAPEKLMRLILPLP